MTTIAIDNATGRALCSLDYDAANKPSRTARAVLFGHAVEVHVATFKSGPHEGRRARTTWKLDGEAIRYTQLRAALNRAASATCTNPEVHALFAERGIEDQCSFCKCDPSRAGL